MEGSLILRFYSRFFGALLLTITILATACAGDGDEQVTKSHKCELTQSKLGVVMRYCAQYQGLTDSQVSDVKNLCTTDNNGVWSSDSQCSQSDLKGKCHFSRGSISFSYYYYSGHDENSALESCLSSQGRFERA